MKTFGNLSSARFNNQNALSLTAEHIYEFNTIIKINNYPFVEQNLIVLLWITEFF
jgi:hypothetical protein